MGAPQQIILGIKGFVATTWDPANKGAAVTLSGGNLVVTEGSGNRCVISVAGKTTGKYYWEITVTTSAAPSDYIGFANGSFVASTATQSLGLNTGTNEWGYRGDGALFQNSGVLSSGYGTYTTGTVLMFAFDMGAGKFWIGAGGTWGNSGNPGAGTNPAVSGLTGTLYAAAGGATSGVYTANFGASAFTYTVPTGFTGGLG